MKRFRTMLSEFLSGVDKNEKFTPAELIERIKSGKTNRSEKSDILGAALKSPRFTKKVVRAYRRSECGRVVMYVKGGRPMVMTTERWDALQGTIKAAQVGLRRYHETRKASAR